MNIWGTLAVLSASVAVGGGVADRGDVAGGFGLLAVALFLAFLYFRMDTVARLQYWMEVPGSFKRGGRCLECGNAAPSRAYPFCSEEHQDKHEASTAW